MPSASKSAWVQWSCLATFSKMAMAFASISGWSGSNGSRFFDCIVSSFFSFSGLAFGFIIILTGIGQHLLHTLVDRQKESLTRHRSRRARLQESLSGTPCAFAVRVLKPAQHTVLE